MAKLRILLGHPALPWHQSNAIDRVNQARINTKAAQLQDAVEWCQEQNCRGYLAVKSGHFPQIKDPRTINKRLDKIMKVGEDRWYCTILTEKEESSLVRYLKNRNRCLQSLTEKEVEQVVLRMLQYRKMVNKKGGRMFIALTRNAKQALEKNKVSRSFFRRLFAKNPELVKKKQKKVEINRGLNCTREMATEYLDDLAALLNQTGIADLTYVEPGVWEGPIDTSRIIGHDETPQFINHGKSAFIRNQVIGVRGQSSETLASINRECNTVHPFHDFDGNHILCQVIFSGSGISSHMAPESTSQIANLLISVNKSGVSDHETLLAAYKKMNSVLDEKRVVRPVVVIEDGHASRFDEGVMQYALDHDNEQFLLHPDTSSTTQMHDQVNTWLHKKYDDAKDEMYSRMANLNREDFMHIIAKCYGEAYSRDALVKAAKRVGISSHGLNVNWMQQDKFARAAALLSPEKSEEPKTPDVTMSLQASPVGVRKRSAKWYEFKLAQSLNVIKELQQTPVSPEDVPGIMPIGKIQPKKTKVKRITQVHGSLSACDLLEKVKEANKKEQEMNERKQEAAMKKERLKEVFLKCKVECQCGTGSCEAKGLKQCPVCLSVQKSACSKKECVINGQKPVMLLPAQKTPKSGPSSRAKRRTLHYSSSEDGSDSDDGSEKDDTEDEETYSDNEEELANQLSRVWESVSPPVPEENIVGKWYAVIVRSKRRKTLYIAKIIQRFLDDHEGEVESLEMRCLMPKHGSGNVIDDTPELLPDDNGIFTKEDVIAGPLSVECKPRERKFIVKDYEDIVDFFNKVKDLE